MTITESAKPKLIRPDWLANPVSDADVAIVHDLAVQLGGRLVPGVRMSENEFHAWCHEDIRAEWVSGQLLLLPRSTIAENELTLWLSCLIRWVVSARNSYVLGLKAQIRLTKVRQRRTPDVLFVSSSRRRIIKEYFIDGPPDMVMEIVSPESQVRDWHDKYIAYELSGVKEYWVIDPKARRVEAYWRGRDGKYSPIKETGGRIRSKVLRKLYIRPQWLWQSPLLKTATVLKELGVRG